MSSIASAPQKRSSRRRSRASHLGLKIGESTRDTVVTEFGEPLARCAAPRCEGPGTVSNGRYGDVIGVNVPVGSTCMYYNNGDTESSLFTLRFDTKTGKVDQVD